MKNEFNKYGKRLTEAEYVQAVSALTYDKEYRKKETSLKIDHTIGEDYPQDKRELMHAARERAVKRFLSPATIVKGLAVTAALKFGIMKRMPGLDEGDIDRGTKIMAEEFTKEKALATEDIIQFLGEEFEKPVKKLRGLQP